MINFKKMDDEDFVFINETSNNETDRAFSSFLKSRNSIVVKNPDIIRKRKFEFA